MIKKAELPEFLEKLPRVDFARKPASTHAASLDPDVIYDVVSLDDLFEKAEKREKLKSARKSGEKA